MLIHLPILILSLALTLTGCASAPKVRTVDPEWIKPRVILNMLERYYYKEIDRNKCVEAMLKGGVSECTDPHSYYADAKMARLEMDKISGHFGGIGMGLEGRKVNGQLEIFVKSVTKNAPAEKGGVKPGDVLFAVSPTNRHSDMKLVKGLSVFEVVNLVRGEPGTELILTIFRAGHYKQIRLVREDIKIVLVESRLIKKGIGYVQLKGFDMETAHDFFHAVQALKKNQARALIVDVRGNPGGVLQTICQILSFFTPSGKVSPLVYTEGRYESENEVRLSNGKVSYFSNLKVVVLADRNSASASEILTAWFRADYGAVVVGEKTFGKGSVQQNFPLIDGSYLHLTIAHYFVGKKKVPVHDIGVQPTIMVEGDKAQLKRAIAEAEKLLKN
ncbi:MAG: S41 family peptidase [bacterium]|nr:S41 family peptidase [bacterium]